MKRTIDVAYGSYKKKKAGEKIKKRVARKYAARQFAPVGSDSTGSRAITIKYTPPFGYKMKARLSYAEFGSSLNPTIGPITAGYAYSTNGLYDPNITGAGHQPMGFDQLMLIYERYTVIHAKIIVTLTNKDTTNDNLVGVMVSRQTSPNVSAQQIIEQGLGVYKSLAPAGNNGDSVTLELSINPNKFLNKSDPLDDEDLAGTSSNNPGTQAYFLIWASGYTSDTSTVLMSSRLEYVAIFHMPKELTQS